MTVQNIPSSIEVMLKSRSLSEFCLIDLQKMAGNSNASQSGKDLMQKIQEGRKYLARRNKRLINSIKSHGYYAKDFYELSARIRQRMQLALVATDQNTLDAPVLKFVLTILYGKYTENSTHCFSDNDWETAIELGIFLVSPEAYAKENEVPLDDYVDKHLDVYCPYIWLSLLFIHMTNELTLRVDDTTFQALKKEKNMLAQQVENYRRKADELQRSLNESEQCSAIALSRAVREAESKARSDERQKQAREIKLRERTIREQAKEIEELRNQLKALSDEGHMNSSKPAAPQSTILTEPSTNMAADAESSDLNIELPSRGVAIVGDDRTLLRKVVKSHPDWVLISAKSVASIDPSISLVIIHTKNVGHDLGERVRAKAPAGAEVIYVSRTNLNLLEQEIQKRYAGILEKAA